MTDILIKPVITEKSMQDAANSRFTFAVASFANKAQIAHEVASHFNVKVVSVKTTTIKGRLKRAGRTRQEYLTSPWKKAIIELVKGQKIDLFDITENAKKA